MRAINRKVLRDLVRIRGQALAICLVMASGVATFVMSLSTLHSLEGTLEAYYERYRFAEVFAHLKRAPKPLADRIAEIPGVAQVETRVVEGVTLDMPDLVEPAVGQLISVPRRKRPLLNDVYLRSGRYLEPDRDREVLVSEGFADAHGLVPGDTVTAVINGRLDELKIVGVALSPEYIYQIRPGEILPDDERFGVFWMEERELAAAFDMEGAFNDISLSLTPGAQEDEVIARLDRLTEAYGGLGAYGRNDQVSHKFVANEIEELRATAAVVPVVFLAVAAFLLNVVLSRLVSTQREQVAALKALGYSRLEIGLHYLKLVMMIVLLAVALGSVVGAWMGKGMTALYSDFFRFPAFGYHVAPSEIVLALGVSVGAAVVGTIGAVRKAVNLPPAEAMRPAPPASYRPTLIERTGLQRFLPPAVRMILRQLERRPVKALLSCAGIALAVSILVLGNFMEDAIDHLMELEFSIIQRQDVMVAFIEPASPRALSELRHLPGARACEPFRAVATRLRHGHHARRVGIMGLEPDGQLFRLFDRQGEEIPIPPTGLVLSEKLAEILDVNVGDSITVEVLEERRPVREISVVGLVADYSGLAAYQRIDATNRLMRQEDVLSGAFISADPAQLERLHDTLKNTPGVASVTVKDAALESFRETLAESMLLMKTFNVIFAVIIAFGVVYNSARISLSERSRELATLRVIGFTRAEISFIQLGELGILTLVSIPAGLVLGYTLAWLTSTAYDSELFRIPLVVYRGTYGFATIVVLTATVFSGLVVRRMLDRLDLVAVLKTRE